MSKYKKVLSSIAIIGLFTALTACSTIEGVGEDMQKAGEWIEEKAKQ